jgi:hypothetical protein
MGAFGKMIAVSGCDLVTGTQAFPARNGTIYMFKSADDTTEIDEFDEVPVNGVLNNRWDLEGLTTEDAETIDDRTYCGVALATGTEIWFDGPVTSITLTAGSGWVYYDDQLYTPPAE